MKQERVQLNICISKDLKERLEKELEILNIEVPENYKINLNTYLNRVLNVGIKKISEEVED